MIKELGIVKFRKAQAKDPKFAKLEYLELPKCYKWIWGQFYNLWSCAERDMNGNAIITPRTILDYEECFCVHFTVAERKLIFRMKDYTTGAIAAVEGKTKDE